jgi:hypothetical protein
LIGNEIVEKAVEDLNKGNRVGVIVGVHDDKTISFLGYGELLGYFVPDDEAAGFWADRCREDGTLNPKIKLDIGGIVWGCECWWGPEGEIKERMAKYVEEGYLVYECTGGCWRHGFGMVNKKANPISNNSQK